LEDAAVCGLVGLAAALGFRLIAVRSVREGAAKL